MKGKEQSLSSHKRGCPGQLCTVLRKARMVFLSDTSKSQPLNLPIYPHMLLTLDGLFACFRVKHKGKHFKGFDPNL